MGYIAKLKHGNKELDLSSGNYALMQGFVPPTTPHSLNLASGTSANRFGGSELIGKRANNMSFSFSVRILGNSVSETDMCLRTISQFLKLADDKSNKLYFEWKPDNNYDYEPLWGQYGAFVKCEVVYGSVDRSPLYTVYNIREKSQLAIVSLLLKPYAQGKKQRVGTAVGGICEDWMGAPDGISRGTIIPEAGAAAGNEFLNPIFGDSTYNDDWDDDANVTDTENTDPEFVMFGTSSVKLWASADDQYSDTLTLDNTETFTLSFYVKKPDSSAVTSSDIACHYDGDDLTTTYTSVGSGWYRISAQCTGDGAAGKVGVTVKADRVIYMDGAMCEMKAYLTPFYYGDMLGCAWSGTAHASASTRTASTLYFNSSTTSQIMTVRVVMKANLDHDEQGDMHIFDDGTYALYYGVAATGWYLTDGTNTASDTATFSTGDVIVFHATFGPNGVKLYKDGSSFATSASIVYHAPANIYLGSTTGGANHVQCTFLGFATFEQEMTAAEILADYNNITEWVSSETTGKRLEAIPYLWTKDGDNVVDNCNDSTYDNYCVIGGVGGTAPAETMMQCLLSDTFTTVKEVYISQAKFPYSYFVNPDDWMFWDESDVVDGTACGGEYKSRNIGTAETNVATVTTATELHERMLLNLTDGFYYFIRMKDASATETFTIKGRYNLNQITVDGEPKDITINTAYRLFYTPPLYLPTRSDLFLNETNTGTSDYGIVYSFTVRGYHSASTTDVYIDYFCLMPRPLIKLDLSIHSTGLQRFIVLGSKGVTTEAASISDILSIDGDVIEFVPDRYNLIQHLIGSDAVAADIDWSITYTNYITPRYEIL